MPLLYLEHSTHECGACEPCGYKGMFSWHCQAMEAVMVWQGDTTLYPM